MPSRTRDRLDLIRENVLLAQQFIGELSPEEFARDTQVLYATIRCLEIISEASRHLPPDLKAKHSGLPWSQIAGSGNIYRHDYPVVNPATILATVRTALPPLLAAVEHELGQGATDP